MEMCKTYHLISYAYMHDIIFLIQISWGHRLAEPALFISSPRPPIDRFITNEENYKHAGIKTRNPHEGETI